MKLILYSKPGCHLCETLEEKLYQVTALSFEVEIRDITSRADWFKAYEYEIPVLCQQLPQGEQKLPYLSPRSSIQQLEQLLSQNLVSG